MRKQLPNQRRIEADIRRSRSALGRSRLGLFSIEGTRLHERALRAGVKVEAALVAEGFGSLGGPRARRLLQELADSGCALLPVPDRRMEELTEGRDVGALVGLVRLPPAPSLPDLLAGAGPQPPLLLVVVDVEEPGNVGALVRTALASGCSGFVAVGVSDPYHPKAVRTSMGAVFRLPIGKFAEATPLLEQLSARGVATLGALSRGGEPPDELRDTGRPTAVLIGSEAFGLPSEIRERLDRAVTVPMSCAIDSYSVNAAAAILLYELGRQRRRPGIEPGPPDAGPPCAPKGGTVR